jgi:hypothetical protein
MLREIALVPSSRNIPLADVTRTAAALQKQVLRDLRPLWKCRASVSAYASLSDVPRGTWPILLADDGAGPGAAGMHLDRNGNPYCIVEYGPTWSLAASHECLQMLVDPTGNRQIWGPSPVPDQGEVGFLLEVCNPCEDAQFAYSIDGVLVADFCTPQFFSVEAPGPRCSFSGAIERPFTALRNGHLSWYDPASLSWYQQRYFGSQPKLSRLGLPNANYRCLREFANRADVDLGRLSHLSATSAATQRARQILRESLEASAAAAAQLQEEIAELARRLGHRHQSSA